VQAVRMNDFAGAKSLAERLSMHGELLAIHPDFVRCFTNRAQGVDPRETLRHLSQFLVCATENRARVAGS
jgi:hypothetical protein